MAHDPENPFSDIECDWENVEKAKPGMSTGRIAPFNAYKGICVAFDPKGDGNMTDKEYFVTPTKTKAIKIQVEIVEPDNVEGEVTKGKTYEHVFWITPANWPYVKRDAETILGKEIKNPNELLSSVWAGKTVEFGLKDETYNGFVRSKSTHFNPWAPETAVKGPAAAGQKKADAKPAAGQKARPAATATASAQKGKEADVDF